MKNPNRLFSIPALAVVWYGQMFLYNYLLLSDIPVFIQETLKGPIFFFVTVLFSLAQMFVVGAFIAEGEG